MPCPVYIPLRSARKPGRKAHHRISLTLGVSANGSSSGDLGSSDDSYFHDRWHLLSPDFDELPEDLRELL